MNRNELNKVISKILKAYEEIRLQSSLNGNSEVLEANREIGRILQTVERKTPEPERLTGKMFAIYFNCIIFYLSLSKTNKAEKNAKSERFREQNERDEEMKSRKIDVRSYLKRN